VGEKLTILDAGVEDPKCNDLADKFNVAKTPTAFFYKGGEQKARIDTDGKTYEQIRQELAALIK